jgi:hypothetical protein
MFAPLSLESVFFDRVAPVPDVISTPNRDVFVHDVTTVMENVCQEMGAGLY